MISEYNGRKNRIQGKSYENWNCFPLVWKGANENIVKIVNINSYFVRSSEEKVSSLSQFSSFLLPIAKQSIASSNFGDGNCWHDTNTQSKICTLIGKGEKAKDERV